MGMLFIFHGSRLVSLLPTLHFFVFAFYFMYQSQHDIASYWFYIEDAAKVESEILLIQFY